jgi:hypothetical protein
LIWQIESVAGRSEAAVMTGEVVAKRPFLVVLVTTLAVAVVTFVALLPAGALPAGAAFTEATATPPVTASNAAAANPLAGRRFVASYGSFQCPNIGLFAAATGHLVRVLRRHDDAELLTVSPTGKSLLYVNDPVFKQTPAACRATARRDGTGTVLRIPLSGGRPVDTGRHASVLALSPDGRMVAWVTGEQLVRLHVRNRVTGRTRRFLIADNHGIGNPTAVLGLAWAPSGKRLAISLGDTAVINWIHVMDPWTVARGGNTDSGVRGCHTTCSAPAYSPAGHLMFLRQVRSGLAAQLRENVGGRSRVTQRVDRPVDTADIDPSGAALVATGRLFVVAGKQVRELPDRHFGSPTWVPAG